MQLSIISINHKKPQQAITCMASLWKQYQKEFEANEFEYILVDNFSEDDSLHILGKEIKKYKNFHLLANNQDAGFGAGNNFGVKKAQGTYLLFLNDDTIVEDRGIAKMLEYLKQHEEIGVLGGKIVNFDGSEQLSSGKFYSLFTFTLFILGMQRFGLIDKNPKTIQEVDWIKGALFMIKKTLYEKVGGYDEHIWMYTEDIELCYRIHKHGLKCVFFPDISIKHKEQGSTNRTFAIVNIYKNLPYFYKKHKSSFAYHYVKLLLKTKAAVLLMVGKLTHNKYLKDTYSQALNAVK
ncbi:MAG TPA: glycosyltransferase family 2 protein [Candidatus Sulfotelmatobacter sp.]|jgi:GT2 family glycosyltransferase|nr:glycosyltransferase family 2 protein [Candidatus Sulfotelmatobacter sp.]